MLLEKLKLRWFSQVAEAAAYLKPLAAMNLINKIIWPLKVGALFGRAKKSLRKGDLEVAIDYYLKAFRYSTDEEIKAFIVENISNIYWKMGNFEEALKYAEGAQAFYEVRAKDSDRFYEANLRLLGNIARINAANQKIKAD